MINNNQIPQSADQLDPDLVILQKAIRQKETGNKAILPGEGSSVGGASRYQYTHNTWKEVAGNYLGDPNAPLTLENENKATYLRLKDLRNQGYSAPQIASMHNAGITKPNAYKENWKGTNKWGVKYDTPKYVSEVMNIANQMRRQNTGYNNVPVAVKTVNPETENKASFEYNPNDSLISGVGKTIGNAPKSVWNLLKGIGSAIVHPVDTIGAVGNLAKGTVGYLGTKLLGDKMTDLVPTEEEQAVGHFINRNNNKGIYADNPDSFVNKLGNILGPSTENIDTAKGFGTYMKDRYGGAENINKTLVEDPAGLALDASMLLSGGASTGAKVAGWADKANMVKTANTLRKVGNIAQKTGEIIDPLRAVGKVAKPITKPIGDILTKSGGDIQTEAFVKGFDTMGQKTIKNARKNNAYEWVDSKGVKRVEDPLQTAIEYGANKNYKIADGKVNFDATIENLNSHIPNNVEALVNRLNVEGKTLSVDEFRQAIVDGINSADTTQVFKKQLIDKLDSELKWYKDTYPNDQIPMSELYKRKVELDKVYNPETIDLNRSMGDSIRTKLYNATEDGIIKDLLNENRRIINARDLLIKANNATVRGGRIGTAMGRLLGTGIGGAFGSVGGPLGASVGGMAGAGIGDAIAKVGQARTFRSIAGDIKGGLERLFGRNAGATKTGSEILQETANTVRPVPQMTEEMKYLPAPEMAGSRASVNVPISLPQSARENFLGMDTSRNAVIKNPADRRKLINIFGNKQLPQEVIDKAYPNAFKKIDQIIQEPKVDFKSIPLSSKGGAVSNEINNLGMAMDMYSELNALRGDLVKQLTQIGDKNALSNVEAKIRELDAYIKGESGRIRQNLQSGFISTEEALTQAMKIPVFRQLRERGMVKLANEYLHSREALGSYMEGVIKFVDNPHPTTLPHETFHATMDLVLSAEEKANAIQTAKRLIGNTADDLRAEEFLAQSFAEWYVKGSSKSLPQIIASYFKKIKQFFTGIVDDQDKIEAMFRDITKREIQKPAGVSEEMWQRLIHTTDKKGFDGILKKGFDEKKRRGNRYGLGEYFTIKNKENPLGNSFYGKYKVSTKDIDLSKLKLKELSEYNKFGSKRDLLMDMGVKEMRKAGVDNNLIEKFIYDEDTSIYSNFLKNKGYDGIKIGDSEVLLFDNELSNKLLDRKYTEKINEINKEKFQKINLKRYANDGFENTDRTRGGTWYFNGDGEVPFTGLGGKKEVKKVFDDKKTLKLEVDDIWDRYSSGATDKKLKEVLGKEYSNTIDEMYNLFKDRFNISKDLMKSRVDRFLQKHNLNATWSDIKYDPKSQIEDMIVAKYAKEKGYNAIQLNAPDNQSVFVIKSDKIKIYRGQKDAEFSMEGKSAGIGKSFTTDKNIAEVYGSDGTIIERFIDSDDILRYNEIDKETQRYIKSIIDERIDRVKSGLENENIKPFEQLVLELGEIARIKNKKAIDIGSFGIPSESEIRILSDSVLKGKSQINSSKNLSKILGENNSMEKFQKKDNPLIQEAKKYKSAEEFVKAQGKTVYHGTNAKFDVFDKSKIGEATGVGDWGDGFYFSDSKDVAKSFAKDAGGDTIMEVNLKNLKFADGNKLEKLPEIQDILDDGMGFTDIGEYLKSKGYDGIKYKHKEGGGTEYVVYDADKIKTKSQLEDIWNQANKNNIRPVVIDKYGTPIHPGGRNLADPSEGAIYYHGTVSENKASLLKEGFNPSSNKKGFAEQPEAFYIGSYDTASMYGNDMVGVRVKKGAKVNTLKMSSQEWADTVGKSMNSKEVAEALREIRARGYDAVNVGNEIEILNPSKFEIFDVKKEKSLYEQVTGKKPEDFKYIEKFQKNKTEIINNNFRNNLVDAIKNEKPSKKEWARIDKIFGTVDTRIEKAQLDKDRILKTIKEVEDKNNNIKIDLTKLANKYKQALSPEDLPINDRKIFLDLKKQYEDTQKIIEKKRIELEKKYKYIENLQLEKDPNYVNPDNIPF